jgi:hypothetical protein
MKTLREHICDLNSEDSNLAMRNVGAADLDEDHKTLRDALLYLNWESTDRFCIIRGLLRKGTYFDAPQHTQEDFKAKAKERMATPEDRADMDKLIEGLPDSGERSEFDTGAVRDASEGKGVPSHLPTRALMRASKRFEDGAIKYDAHNWRKGIPLSRYVDSLNRHLWAFMQGDTSEDHAGAIVWNAMCLSETYDLMAEDKLPKSLNDLPEHQYPTK